MKEKISFGLESDRSIKNYENDVSKLVRSYNSFVENLLGIGKINKEDIFRIDAQIENQLREEIKEKEEEEIKSKSTDELKFNLSFLKKKLEIFEGLESFSHSYKYDPEYSGSGSSDRHINVLKAKTKGQDLEIEREQLIREWERDEDKRIAKNDYSLNNYDYSSLKKLQQIAEKPSENSVLRKKFYVEDIYKILIEIETTRKNMIEDFIKNRKNKVKI